jgi:hypothetical protein
MDNSFDMPNMDDINKQMQDAMEQAQKAMDDLPEQMEDMQNVMGSLSSLMGNLPGQLNDLGSAMQNFETQHEENMETATGQPDWEIAANIHVGSILNVIVKAEFDLQQIIQAYHSTQGGGFEDLVRSVAGDAVSDLDDDTMGQVMQQLGKGRSTAKVTTIKIQSCTIAGAPANAEEQLKLSPQAGIPLMMDNGRIGFEFSPMLTIRNQWENANIPVFTPMAEQIQIPLIHFEGGKLFQEKIKVNNQEIDIQIEIVFLPKA